MFDLATEVVPGELGGTVERTELAHGAWIDLRPGWIAGADELFLRLRDGLPWRAERWHMYERMVDVPRLLCYYEDAMQAPEPALIEIKRRLDEHYGPELGEPFTSIGLCLYRDGRDSVAWHGDRHGRGNTDDTMVAIVSVGEPRALTLRPRTGGGPEGQGGGKSIGGHALKFDLGHGDLIVMGGSCQRTWEHAVPKTARPVGPRISIQYRPVGVS